MGNLQYGRKNLKQIDVEEINEYRKNFSKREEKIRKGILKEVLFAKNSQNILGIE